MNPTPKDAFRKSKLPINDSSANSATITSADLCQMTGLTERRHQQLATAGLFPLPKDGAYQLIPTVKGIIGHYRELASKQKAGLAAKQELLLDKKIERAEFDLSVSRQEFKPTEEIARQTMAIGEEMKSALQFHLIDQLPGLCAGMPATQIREHTRGVFVQLCKRFQAWAVSQGLTEKPTDKKEAAE